MEGENNIMFLYGAAVIIWLMFLCIFVYKASSEYFFIFIYLFFTHIWMIISNLFIENGVYLIQTFRQGEATGATVRLLMLDTIFFVVVCFSLKLLSKHKTIREEIYVNVDNTEEGNNVNLWLNIMLFVSLYCLLDVLVSGNIFTNSAINKGNYYALFSRLPFAYYLDLMAVCFAFIAGMIFWESLKQRNKKRIIKIISIITITILYRFLRGLTFTTNFIYIVSFVTPIMLHFRIRHLKINKKIFAIMGFVLAILIAVKVNDFSTNYSNAYAGVKNTETAFGKLIYRGLALQGEVWWGIDDMVVNKNANDISQISNEVKSIVDSDEVYKSGIYHLMTMLNHKFSRDGSDNLTLNCGYPAIIISIFGYSPITILIIIVEAFLYAVIIVYTYKITMKKRYAHAFFAYGILSDLNVAFIMGGLYYFFTTKIILCLCGLILLNRVCGNKKIKISI